MIFYLGTSDNHSLDTGSVNNHDFVERMKQHLTYLSDRLLFDSPEDSADINTERDGADSLSHQFQPNGSEVKQATSFAGINRNEAVQIARQAVIADGSAMLVDPAFAYQSKNDGNPVWNVELTTFGESMIFAMVDSQNGEVLQLRPS